MRISLLFFVLVILTACNGIDPNAPVGTTEFAQNAEGPTGCSTLRICEPCDTACTLGASKACVAQKCAFTTKCLDTPPTCTAKCSVKCVNP